MKLIRISLCNFRGVSNSTVKFSSGVTVIAGPNEVGKSSIAEALRLIREVKSSSASKEIKNVKPVNQDVGPEVEVELKTGPYRLIYHKRWLKQQLTELFIHEPTPEQFTGGQAHEKFLQILNDTVDTDLLTAMEVVQGKSLAQPKLAQISSLQNALDDSDESSEDNDLLMQQIEQEYLSYFTRTGKPTGDYKDLPLDIDSLQLQLSDFEGRQKEMDHFVQEFEDNTVLLKELEIELLTAKNELTECEVKNEEINKLRHMLAEAQHELSEATRRLAEVQTIFQARQDQIAELASRTTEIAVQEDLVKQLKVDHHNAEKDFLATQQQVENQQELYNEIRSQLVTIDNSLKKYQTLLELNELNKQLELAKEIHQQQLEAKAILKNCKVTAKIVEELQQLSVNIRIAESTRDASLAQVSVQQLGDNQVVVNGVGLADNQIHRQIVSKDIQIEVPGVISLQVQPGTPSTDLAKKVDESHELFTAALAKAGISSLAQANKALEQRLQAERNSKQTKDLLAQILAGKTLENMETRLALLKSQLPDENNNEFDINMLDSNIAQCVEEKKKAESQLAEIETQLTENRHILEQLRNSNNKSRETWVREDEKLKTAIAEQQKTTTRLDNSRATRHDDLIAQDFQEAKALLETKQLKLATANQTLAQANPEQLEMMLNNARELVESKNSQRANIQKRITELDALIKDREKEGIYDKISEITDIKTNKEVSLARITRSANAINLLRSILIKHREQAQQKYVAPFKDKIEHLGRIIFGSDFQVNISKDLYIISRTLNGCTVDFESLSAGAKEQLSLLGRLACAQLVDTLEGAPVILDDTLGFSDEKRLATLNIVLNAVGQKAQVVLLTCQPKRFAKLGGAKIIRLTP